MLFLALNSDSSGITSHALITTTSVLVLPHNITKMNDLIHPLTAKFFNLNFHLLEVVSRWRDPQLRVSENYSDLQK